MRNPAFFLIVALTLAFALLPCFVGCKEDNDDGSVNLSNSQASANNPAPGPIVVAAVPPAAGGLFNRREFIISLVGALIITGIVVVVLIIIFTRGSVQIPV